MYTHSQWCTIGMWFNTHSQRCTIGVWFNAKGRYLLRIDSVVNKCFATLCVVGNPVCHFGRSGCGKESEVSLRCIP